ncbi:MAG: hypothetical protein WD851_09345 [Pirellulales bacterium]
MHVLKRGRSLTEIFRSASVDSTPPPPGPDRGELKRADEMISMIQEVLRGQQSPVERITKVCAMLAGNGFLTSGETPAGRESKEVAKALHPAKFTAPIVESKRGVTVSGNALESQAQPHKPRAGKSLRAFLLGR